MYRVILLGTLVLMFLILQVAQPQNSTNNQLKPPSKFKCSNRRFESLFNRLIIVPSRERNFPETFGELPEYCRTNFKLIDEIDLHRKRCLGETVRSIVSVVNYSMRIFTRRLCNNRKGVRTRKWLASAPCMNRVKPEIIKCIDEVGVAFGRIKHLPDTRKMPHICCQYVSMLGCLEKSMAGECAAHYPTLENQVQTVMGSFVEQTCGEYNRDTDKCDKLEPLPKVNVTNPSFIFNMVAMFESINS